MRCKICNIKSYKVWQIKNSPIPNIYLKNEFDSSKSEAKIYYCSSCYTIKNNHKFSDSEIFSSYHYRSPKSKLNDNQIKFISKIINKKNLKNVLEIGCNNGMFLKSLKKLNLTGSLFTGIDPIQQTRKESGIKFVKGFLNRNAIEKFNNLEKFDLVILRHVFAHNEDINLLTANIMNVVADKSYIYIENADLEKTYSMQDFSQFYSEHFYALSKYSIKKLFYKYHFYTECQMDWEIHNGSFGILLSNSINKNQEKKSRNNILPKSEKIFEKTINDWMTKVTNFFKKLEDEDRKIYIWGCSAKATFVLNIFEINTNKGYQIIDGAFDSTKEKVNSFIPGTNIKIMPETVSNNLIDNALIIVGARNFEKQVVKKIRSYSKTAKIIIPLF